MYGNKNVASRATVSKGMKNVNTGACYIIRWLLEYKGFCSLEAEMETGKGVSVLERNKPAVEII